MKRHVLCFILLLFPAAPSAQWGTGISGNAGIALNRIEQALRSGSPESISDMFAGSVLMRLGDSLYIDIAGMQASALLNKFFADKKVVSFSVGLPGSGSMIYTEGGKQDTTRVDVWLQRALGGPNIRALNISNYPLATVFFDIHKDGK